MIATLEHYILEKLADPQASTFAYRQSVYNAARKALDAHCAKKAIDRDEALELRDALETVIGSIELDQQLPVGTPGRMTDEVAPTPRPVAAPASGQGSVPLPPAPTGRKWAIIAAVGLAIIIGVLLLFQQGAPDNDAMAQNARRLITGSTGENQLFWVLGKDQIPSMADTPGYLHTVIAANDYPLIVAKALEAAEAPDRRPHFVMDIDPVYRRFIGKQSFRIHAVMRCPDAACSPAGYVSYYNLDGGSSGWRRFSPATELTLVTLEIESGGDISKSEAARIAFSTDFSPTGSSLEIVAVALEILP
ncbi:MAG: hypothetical protein WBO55_18980 [Rhizobiaceae bacterium]